MEWKQPEGLRRHWILEAVDGELLFSQTPMGAAQGRLGEDVYDLRDGGILRKKRTMSIGARVLATLEQRAVGADGDLHYGGKAYRWRSVRSFGTRWALEDEEGETVFRFALQRSLAQGASVEMADPADESLWPMLLLCWYVMVL